jgi:hypothetical protein
MQMNERFRSLLAGVLSTGLLLALLGIAKPARASELDFDCVPVEVAVLFNRVHMRCQTPVAFYIYFFALPTSDPQADRLLSLASTAMAIPGAKVSVHFEGTDTSGTSYGCSSSDCRKPMRFFLHK